ncbi:NAD-glutamate dehydrogenase [Suttonella sp. R2A3]|uniref:NAD-glutamate dehydrogenase n=1 Tax=Suttonella sp. R2A3 TaxID=2908648 RepID=UPI001F1F17C8|nr:NAD-glutamate dehydrogenase [Suttonella sp. R2A3]UJF24419.1 NAD-glutamate dehydrogenase [Suttonella sp. R2A3]
MSTLNDKRFSEIVTLAGKFVSASQQDALNAFARAYLTQLPADEAEQMSDADLAGNLLTHFTLLQRYDGQAPQVRVFNPTVEEDHFHTPHTVIELVMRDRPFLVDTLQMCLEAEGLVMHRLLHTIVELTRDDAGEIQDVDIAHSSDARYLSVIYCEVDRQEERAEQTQIKTALLEQIQLLDKVTDDWQPMQSQLSKVRDELAAANLPGCPFSQDEMVAFVDWMLDGNFTFLGFREYRITQGKDDVELHVVGGTGLGMLDGVDEDRPSKSFAELPSNLKAMVLEPQGLLLSKSSHLSTIHRKAYMDFLGIQRFDADGNVIGEYRFIGLLTASAYQLSVDHIPLLREKANQVLDRAELPENGHAYKKMLHILNTLPRDDLFQATIDELYPMAMGILHLQDKKRLRLFTRVDHYQRFVSCLVYVPREKFNTALRVKIQNILLEAFGGASCEFNTQFNDIHHARLHVHVRTTPGKIKSFDRAALEKQLIMAMRDWRDNYERGVIESLGEVEGKRLLQRFSDGIPAAYRDIYSTRTAIHDTKRLAALNETQNLDIYLYQSAGERSDQLHLKLYGINEPSMLSQVLPMLENFGVAVSNAHPFSFKTGDGGSLWMQEYDLVLRQAQAVDMQVVREQFEEGFHRVWRGSVESDRFNELVLTTELDVDDVVVLRALSRYMLQARAPFSAEYVQQTLNQNPDIAVALIGLFHTRMDPKKDDGRDKAVAAQRADIEAQLQQVSSLDEDRILRWFLNLINAMLRTNFYQRDENGARKDRLSFKFAASEIEDLPKPRPMFEIFVYSPRVEAVHLRGGKVARGGLRWSDRMEDFRTEILGLVKAQMVKNAVIVPVGSKGGFIVKTPTEGRDAFMEEGKACYRTFIRGMLDITDNLVEGKVVPPADTVRHDEDDPYLVVAADKGTASFSDIANGVAAEYGFWLDDAFASGGSVGYDHKAMGITARGAWESVKRHFRMLGKDIQERDEINVVGIGDMSGDVFGNGMLRSRKIRLQAAFNHLHIFIDPAPDAARSWEERDRLFNLPRSNWADYDASLISQGGGVFSRTEKSIAITPEMKEVFAIEEDKLTPTELIHQLLKAPVDLIWNGGIGTYVKHSEESHGEVGDRANDNLRVDGRDIRAKVIGEGGNLGMTQRGRIEYALAGGRLYTDAIDNSGGVNCSDHEVNIKILLNKIVEQGDMTQKQRNELLASMTEEVGDLVLRQNYMQPQTIEVSAYRPEKIGDYVRIMHQLEREGRLDRAIEFLPEDAEVEQRKKAGQGLTNPELAVMLSYSKMWVYDHLLESDLPDNVYFRRELPRYFPQTLHERFSDSMPDHRLHREIICTYLTNSLVNRMGISFVFRAVEETGESVASIASSYALAREVFGVRRYWRMIEAMDNKIDANKQIELELTVRQLLERAMFWFLRNLNTPIDVEVMVERFSGAVEALTGDDGFLAQKFAKRIDSESEKLLNLGLTESDARALATLPLSFAALDVVLITEQSERDINQVAEVYFAVQQRLQGGWLLKQINQLPADDYWARRARTAQLNSFYATLRSIAQNLLAEDAPGIDEWAASRHDDIERLAQAINELEQRDVDLATLSVVLGEIAALAEVH